MWLGLDDEQHRLDAELNAELAMASEAQHIRAEPAPRAAPIDRAPPGTRDRPDLGAGFADVFGGLSYACPACGVHKHLSLRTLTEASAFVYDSPVGLNSYRAGKHVCLILGGGGAGQTEQGRAAQGITCVWIMWGLSAELL